MSELGPRRSVRVPLHPDDVLLFIHIPKTGGISLISILEEQFSPEQIFPLHSAPDAELVRRFPPMAIAGYRLVRGHFWFGPGDQRIHSHVAQHPVMLTIVREPVARTISAYRHILRNPQARFHEQAVSRGVTLHQFVASDEFDSAVLNRQARALAVVRGGPHDSPTGNRVLSDRALLFLAQERLEQCAFVGLTESYSESLELLGHTFGWDGVVEKHLNRDPEPVESGVIPDATRRVIEEKTAIDSELYRFAQELFQQRMGVMLREREAPYTDGGGRP